MVKDCYSDDKSVCQDWPKRGKLKENIDMSLNELKGIITDNEVVYSYVLTTIDLQDGFFIQKGSAPNFQGGLITLCTCKHFMRTYRSPLDWKNIWIAGFTSVNTTKDHLNYLFYIMRIKNASQSYKELWDWLDDSVRRAKNARYNKCGDVYEPKPGIKHEFNPKNYFEPIKNHVHRKNNEWHCDIDYLNNRTGKRPALLVGDPSFSFLWSQPKIYFKNKHPRTKKSNVRDFVQSLESK